jgi:hypothetical protein
MGNSLIQSGDDDGFNNVPLTGRGAMRGSPIAYNAVDGNYWRDRVDVVNGEKLVVLACRRGYQYWPLDGAAPQLLLDEPGAPHPERNAFGDQDESKWRDGPNGPSDPYVDIWALFCANPETGTESTFITSTAGGFMAVEILVEEIRKKRRRELDAYPLARLEDTTFKTRYGRQETAALCDRRLGLPERRARARARAAEAGDCGGPAGASASGCHSAGPARQSDDHVWQREG